MNGFKTRIKLWDKEKGIMLPSAPLWKCDFYNPDISKYILLFSTGLKDENGKYIFGGDILTLYDSFSLTAYEVRWSTGRFELHTEDDGYGNPNTEEIWGSYQMRIIGNIYETPKLLNRSSSGN